jgi:hypothetical protein
MRQKVFDLKDRIEKLKIDRESLIEKKKQRSDEAQSTRASPSPFDNASSAFEEHYGPKSARKHPAQRPQTSSSANGGKKKAPPRCVVCNVLLVCTCICLLFTHIHTFIYSLRPQSAKAYSERANPKVDPFHYRGAAHVLGGGYTGVSGARSARRHTNSHGEQGIYESVYTCAVCVQCDV